MNGVPEYQVIERDYSWGTLIELYRNGNRVMVVDVYNNGIFLIHESIWDGDAS